MDPSWDFSTHGIHAFMEPKDVRCQFSELQAWGASDTKMGAFGAPITPIVTYRIVP